VRGNVKEYPNPSPTNSSTNIYAMPPPPHDYDSDDSEDGDASEYTETTVLLGYAEPSPSEDVISHLGGEPIWLHPDSPLDARLAKCCCCNKLMSLLLQLNGAVPESTHERMFYVFGCKEKTCRRKTGSVRALRGVKVAKDFGEKEAKARAARDKEAKAAAEERRRKEEEGKPKAGDLLFGSGAGLGKTQARGNPFSISSGGGSTNPFSAENTSSSSITAKGTEQLRKSFADTLKISPPAKSASEENESLLYGPSEPWPSPLPHKYPLFYLDADYETLAAPEPQQKVETDTVEADPMPASDSSADDGKLDTAFQKFADRVAQNPEQVLRYERAGTPLLYSHDDAVAKVLLDRRDYAAKRIPACSGCKKRERVFEFQLMPHTITVLEGEEVGLDGMEWGTIMVGSCLCVPNVRDVNGVGWMEEWVGVQWEAQK